MAKLSNMIRRKIAECTGVWLKDCATWLQKEQCGCCRIEFASDQTYTYSILVGWHNCGANLIFSNGRWIRNPDTPDDDGFRLAYKVGRQTNNNVMQCDFDIDFEMPYVEGTGDVDDTRVVLDPPPTTKRKWEKEATRLRKEARRVWREWGRGG